jgi:formate-dependent nitrite reductase membrane component NrfD
VTASSPTYYDVAPLKQPVWKWYIPAYFFLGGVAGASSTLAAVGARGLPGLRRRARLVSLGALGFGTVALIADLGRTARFLNMLRVFRPSSPMSVGSWVLAVFGPAAGAAAVFDSPAAGAVAGAMGVPLAGYTGVLVASTAVPAWQRASRSLPPLFMASAVAGAASVLELFPSSDAEAAVLRRYGLWGKAGELGAAFALEHELDEVAARPYQTSRMWKAAHACTSVSLLLSLPRRRRRTRELAAAVTGVAGSLLVKLAVMEAGRASAKESRP